MDDTSMMPQKGCQPRFHKNHLPAGFQHPANLRESAIQILGQRRQVVQSALHNYHISGSVGEGQFPAVGDRSPSGSVILRQQSRRKIHSLDL